MGQKPKGCICLCTLFLYKIFHVLYLPSLLVISHHHYQQERNLHPDYQSADPRTWLDTVIKNERKTKQQLDTPKNDKGTHLQLDDLFEDQQMIAFQIMSTLREFMTSKSLRDFEPFRCTINGPGGTGKSVLLNTILATIREMFQYNDTVKSGGPTGVSACNANGETLHRLSRQVKQRGEYTPYSIGQSQKQDLIENYKHLLCLIIDERSMVTSKLLGTTAQVISETVFQGRGIKSDHFGGIPVVVLAGDDYQLAGMHQGAIDCLTRQDGGKMTQKGRQIFIDCSKKVFHLQHNRRMCDNKMEQKELLGRLRIGEHVTDSDVTKLQSLHLDNILKVHGKEARLTDTQQKAKGHRGAQGGQVR